VLLGLLSLPVIAGNKNGNASNNARPYVEVSYLIAPKQLGDFELEHSRFDPE
jgi:hypothetical protein